MPLFLAGLLSLVVSAAAWANEGGSNLEIVTVSNRADLISGGDALVEVRVPKQVSLSAVKVRLNGHDITASFKANAAARTLRGLVTGLVEGRNDVVAEADGKGKGKDDEKEARLTITNHPIGGPVLLGSQTQPWVCATPTGTPESGNMPASNASGLTTFALDPQCNIATEFHSYCQIRAPQRPHPRLPIRASSPTCQARRRRTWSPRPPPAPASLCRTSCGSSAAP
jgi:hypothetical protein